MGEHVCKVRLTLDRVHAGGGANTSPIFYPQRGILSYSACTVGSRRMPNGPQGLMHPGTCHI